jgi:DNA-binding Xre family transcriptional regulator
MQASETLIEALKRELRARQITYAELATRIGISQASVKRLFSRRKLDLERLDAILQAIDCDFSDIARQLQFEQRLLTELSWAQEEELVACPALLLVAVCTLHLMHFEQITAIYRLSAADCTAHLLRLERLGFLDLLPNNRYRLHVARTFRWIPKGPIARFFTEQAHDFLNHDFDGPAESLGMLNLRLSSESRLKLQNRLRELAKEFSAQHISDSALPLAKRYPVSLLIATRSWEPCFMRSLRRLNDQALAAWLDQRAIGGD